MVSTLISGPAGAGKSAIARQIVADSERTSIVLDFQEIYALILGITRNPETGRYPERLPEDAFALGLAAQVRREAINAALENDVEVVATNSDGNPTRRAAFLALLGNGATERVVDPGIEAVTIRLSYDGRISPQCKQAIGRWYDELSEDFNVEVEARASASTLQAVIVQEGRQASGGRSESFAPNSIEWPANGILVRPAHRESTDARAIPKREADGRITISAPLTPALRAAWDAGRRYMSIEFHALQERKVASGAREVLRAMVIAGALVERPEYDTATAELRGATPRRKRYWR